MDPSPDFKARLMQRAAAELNAADTRTRTTQEASGEPAPPPAEGASPPPEPIPPRPEAAPPESIAPRSEASLPPEPIPQRPEAAPPESIAPRSEASLPPEQIPPRPEARPPEQIPPRPEALPPNVIPLWRRAPRWASALAAVLVLGVVALGGYSYQNQIVASYPLSGSVPGSATVNVRRSGAAELQMRGVASPPPGYLYEAWIIPPGGAPIAAGTAPSGDATLPLNDLGSGATVAVTQERSRVDAPTSAPVLAVQL
jgi:hypothetical protein